MNASLLFRVVPLLAAAFIAAAPDPLLANCASPAGVKGEIVYNDDFSTMQFCDGNNWVSMSASGTAVESDPQVDTLTASKWCKANAGGTAIDCTFTTVDATAAGGTGQLQFYSAGTLDADSALIWDKTNDRLGIGSASPTKTIDVVGTFGLTGAATLASTLAVTGDFAVNTNKFTVAASSGNTTVAGTLGVTGAATLSSTLAVTGDVAVNTNKFNITAASGNTTIAGTLGVTGAVTGASFSGVGTSLTALNASNLGSGTVPTARLGSGTGSSSTYLRGDSSWVDITSLIPVPGGSAGHVQFNNAGAFAGSANLFWDSSNTRLGIGTAAPAYPLEVAGKAKSTAVLLTSGTGGAPQGTGSATYWNQAGSDLYFMTGNVGIGTATPAVKLDVVGALTVSGNGSIGGTLNSIGNFSVATNKFNVTAASGNTAIAGTLALGAAGGTAGKITLTGSTSGTVSLQAAAAAGSVTYTLPSADGSSGQVLSTNGSGMLAWASSSSQWTTGASSAIYYNSGNVGIGTTSPQSPLHVNGGITIASTCHPSFQSSALNVDYCAAAGGARLAAYTTSGVSTNLLLNPYGGNVGIGSASPTQKLDVVGTVKASALQTTSYFTRLTSNTTLSSANTMATILSLTVTASATTNAIITYNFSGSCGTANHVVARVLVDGTSAPGSNTITNPGNAYFSLQATSFVSLTAGSHTVELQYRTPATDCTAYAATTDWSDPSLGILLLGN